ncbi:unnamed protein product [Lota lota]
MQSPDLNTFQQRLLMLSDELRNDQLKKMTFLCSSIGKARREKITTGYELFEVLIEQKKVSADDTGFLSELLTKVGRQDLSDKLTNFSTWNGGPSLGPNEPSDAEGVKIDLAAEVIADNLGKNWRKLARKLGLSEVKVQNISRKQLQLDLEEMAMEVIREWRSAQRGEARVEQLLVALRECEQNLTAEKVEDKLRMAKEH